MISQSRKILRRAKRKGWKDFCASLDSKTPTTEIWRMLKRFRNRRLIPANSNSLNKYTENSEAIQDAINKLCPPSCSPPSSVIPSPYQGHLSWLDSPFTINELYSTLQSVKPSSNPGLDRIDNRLIKALPTELLHCLLNIFNNLFRYAVFPSQ